VSPEAIALLAALVQAMPEIAKFIEGLRNGDAQAVEQVTLILGSDPFANWSKEHPK
jgi:hypothetical protein